MPTTPSLKARALSLLAQREHSRHELRRKLLRRSRGGDDGDSGAVAPDDVDRLLDALEQQGWLSDARFAAVRTQARAARLGHRRIRDELARHGIELDADTDASLRASELERARAVWARKYGQPPADMAERARQMRFLAGRGFAHDVVRRAVPVPSAEEPADD
jgi:regulatory protein